MSTTPLELSTTEKLIANCKKIIEQAEANIAFVNKHRAMLDKFSNSSSFGTGGRETWYLHDPPTDVKEFCRAVGGRWVRQSTKHELNYCLNDSANSIVIFGAEKCVEITLDLCA